MKVYSVKQFALKNGGEYVLGSIDLRTHACYLVYGVLAPLEKGRLLRPGSGHEEIVCLVSGEAEVHGKEGSFVLKQGEAFYLKGEDTCHIDNSSGGDSVYIISGGHSAAHTH